MVTSTCSNQLNLTPLSKIDDTFDRAAELKAFDDTKAGVKGVVDSGIDEIPYIFYSPDISIYGQTHRNIPLIDLKDIDKDPSKRQLVVEKIREASETWGFFHLVNHGVPESVVEEMKDGTRRFFEQDLEVKKKYYTRDFTNPISYHSNFNLYTVGSVNWRDTLYCVMGPEAPAEEQMPEACRDILVEYSKEMKELGKVLMGLFSEGLGLKTNHLVEMECNKGLAVLCHYYPACPQPELTLAATEHVDDGFFTVLIQDDIGGLQVFCEDQWFDVTPVPGSLVINVGILLQLVSNDKYKSAVHRVVTKRERPRISVATFYTTGVQESSKLYGPIKELVSEENPPKFRDTTIKELTHYFRAKGFTGNTALDHFRI